VNNALSFVASIGNKLTPQSPATSAASTAATAKTPSAPPNLCGFTSYGQDGGNSFGVHPWHASITVVKGEDSKQVVFSIRLFFRQHDI
jgi:hypothetical protein